MYIRFNSQNLTFPLVTTDTVNGHVTVGQNIQGYGFTLETTGDDAGKFRLVRNNEEIQAQGIGTVQNGGFGTLYIGGNWELRNAGGSAITVGSKVIGAQATVGTVTVYGLCKAADLTLGTNPTPAQAQQRARARGTVYKSTNTTGTAVAEPDVAVLNA